VRLAARDVAGDATAEPVFEVAPEAMREAVLRETVLLLSRALLRRSRMVKYVCGESQSLRFLGSFNGFGLLGCNVSWRFKCGEPGYRTQLLPR
jgi:hypothetical protein